MKEGKQMNSKLRKLEIIKREAQKSTGKEIIKIKTKK